MSIPAETVGVSSVKTEAQSAESHGSVPGVASGTPALLEPKRNSIVDDDMKEESKCSHVKSEAYDETLEADLELDRDSKIAATEGDCAAAALVSAESTDDATGDDAELSEAYQPGAASVARKPPTAPQIDAEQLRSDPDFAVICSFINKFFTLMRMEPVSFVELENMFTTLENGRVSKELVDLHLKLLRRTIVKTISNDSFEKYLLKYLSSAGLLQSEKRQLETYGYVHMSILSKLKILRALCELQFDHNLRLREVIPAAFRAMDMRDMVTGVDKDGLAYYCQVDSKYGLRLYTTEQDDESGYSWTLVARDMTDMENLISKLKNNDLGYVKNPKDKREFNRPKECEAEQTLVNMATKKGTFVDVFLDEAALKKLREDIVKEKEAKRSRRNAGLGRDEPQEEPQEEPAPEEVEKTEDPEETDRRVLPKRTASQKAVSNIQKYVTPRKTRGKKPNISNPQEAKEEKLKKESSSDESDDSADSSDEEDLASSDDEFRPKSRKRSSGRRKNRKKKVIEEMDEDDDSDDAEEEVRRRAEGDFSCGLCKQSDNEDILLLCDNCDDAWHTTCLKPPLWFVPAGKWYCPKCEHGMLIERLSYVQEVLAFQQKKIAAEEKKKKAAADRFRREMEYIGVSLNNIIPTTLKQNAAQSSSSQSSDDGQRRSKKMAVKRLNPSMRCTHMPVQTVAEGRSRRSIKKVDYKFSEFDDVIKEACRLNESPPPQDAMKEVARPQGGAGRGKDMANIIEAQKQRDEEEGTTRVSTEAAPRQLHKRHRKLTDLNVDDESDSDSDEYKANESEVEAADEEGQSSSDYVPSDSATPRARSGTGRGRFKATQSDEDFIVSGSDDSYVGSRRKKRKAKERARRRDRWRSSDSESEEDDSFTGRLIKRKRAKRGKKCYDESSEASDDDNEEVQMEDQEDSDAPRTRTGRPLRKAVVKAKSVLVENSGNDEDESSENEANENGLVDHDSEAVDTKRGTKRRITSNSDSDDFKPEEDGDDEEDVDDEEANETSLSQNAPLETEKTSIGNDSGTDVDDLNDLDLMPKPKKQKLEQKAKESPSKTTKDNENNGFPAVEMKPKPTLASVVVLNATPPTTATAAASPATEPKTEEKPRVGAPALVAEPRILKEEKHLIASGSPMQELAHPVAPMSMIAVPPTGPTPCAEVKKDVNV